MIGHPGGHSSRYFSRYFLPSVRHTFRRVFRPGRGPGGGAKASLTGRWSGCPWSQGRPCRRERRMVRESGGSCNTIVRGTPLCHVFPSWTLLLLPTCLPPSNTSSASRCVLRLPMCFPPPDVSSASRLIFHLQTCLPHRLPWSRLPPAFLQHPLAAGTSTTIPRHSAMSRPVRSASPLASAAPLHLPLYLCTFRPHC